MEKDFSLNLRIPKELHEEIKREAIKRSAQTNEMISVSKIVREILDKKFMKDGK